jgi:hypothetical protein
MHYLASVYSFTIPLHVLGLLVAHHKEVTMHTMQKLVCVVRFSWLSAGVDGMDSQLKHTTCIDCYIYIVTSWWWATSKPETYSGIVTE